VAAELGVELSGGQPAAEEGGERALLSVTQSNRGWVSLAHCAVVRVASAGSFNPDRPQDLCRPRRAIIDRVDHVLVREQVLPGPPADVFGFFADAHNLEAITPPWLRFRIATPGPIDMRAGTLIEYRLELHRVPVRWLTRIEIWEPGRRFVDVQVSGPYRHWHHTHAFESHERGTCVRDTVRYALPLGPLGALAHRLFVRRDLERIFDFRREAVARRLDTTPGA
jgi:ligand-binding SRPBCC domain-containing protein